MRYRGLIALFAAAALVLGGTLLRDVHPRALDSAQAAAAYSGTWFCPHGGGDGWFGRLSLTNPGPEPVPARITSMSGGARRTTRSITVPARSDVRVSIDASARESSTEVEYFGGWIGAGWLLVARGDDAGMAAEPCLPSLSRTWIVPDGTTAQGEDAWTVVMNPTAAVAVFAAQLLVEGHSVTTTELSDIVLPPHRSTAIHLNESKLGARTVATAIEAKIGRVAAAGLGVSSQGGIRSGVGMTGPAHRLTFPGGPDLGRSELVVVNAGERAASYAGTLESSARSQPLGQLRGETLPADQARTYEVSTTPDSTIQLDAGSRTGIAASRRTFGTRGDLGSETGASPASAWVVQSGTIYPSGAWRLSLANPGTVDAGVDLWLVSDRGLVGKTSHHVEIPAGRSVLVGTTFTREAPVGAVVAIATDGTFVPLATSYTAGPGGYSVAIGEIIPSRWVPMPL